MGCHYKEGDSTVYHSADTNCTITLTHTHIHRYKLACLWVQWPYHMCAFSVSLHGLLRACALGRIFCPLGTLFEYPLVVHMWVAWVSCVGAHGVIRPHWQCSHSHSLGLLHVLSTSTCVVVWLCTWCDCTSLAVLWAVRCTVQCTCTKH